MFSIASFENSTRGATKQAIRDKWGPVELWSYVIISIDTRNDHSISTDAPIRSRKYIGIIHKLQLNHTNYPFFPYTFHFLLRDSLHHELLSSISDTRIILPVRPNTTTTVTGSTSTTQLLVDPTLLCRNNVSVPWGDSFHLSDYQVPILAPLIPKHEPEPQFILDATSRVKLGLESNDDHPSSSTPEIDANHHFPGYNLTSPCPVQISYLSPYDLADMLDIIEWDPHVFLADYEQLQNAGMLVDVPLNEIPKPKETQEEGGGGGGQQDEDEDETIKFSFSRPFHNVTNKSNPNIKRPHLKLKKSKASNINLNTPKPQQLTPQTLTPRYLRKLQPASSVKRTNSLPTRTNFTHHQQPKSLSTLFNPPTQSTPAVPLPNDPKPLPFTHDLKQIQHYIAYESRIRTYRDPKSRNYLYGYGYGYGYGRSSESESSGTTIRERATSTTTDIGEMVSAPRDTVPNTRLRRTREIEDLSREIRMSL